MNCRIVTAIFQQIDPPMVIFWVSPAPGADILTQELLGDVGI
jgi:hypothetical protein